MGGELQGAEEFERAVGEEIQISSDFGLPLCALALRLPDGPDSPGGADLVRLLLDTLRTGDLVTAVSGDELAVVLPNTSQENARHVGERLLETVPDLALATAEYEPGDTPETLTRRARRSVEDRG